MKNKEVQLNASRIHSSGSTLSENRQKVDEGHGGGSIPLDRRLLMNSFICKSNFFFFNKRLLAQSSCTLGWFCAETTVLSYLFRCFCRIVFHQRVQEKEPAATAVTPPQSSDNITDTRILVG